MLLSRVRECVQGSYFRKLKLHLLKHAPAYRECLLFAYLQTLIITDDMLKRFLNVWLEETVQPIELSRFVTRKCVESYEQKVSDIFEIIVETTQA
jgi:hypothetical protein